MKPNKDLVNAATKALGVFDYLCFEFEAINRDEKVRKIIHDLQRAINNAVKQGE